MNQQNAGQNEKIYRRNFAFFLLDGILFIVALGVMGSTTVIPDFVRRLTDSEIIIGLSSSIFSIGYTLPQLIVARFIVNQERKKQWFIIPNIPTRFVILIFAILIWNLTNLSAEIILLLFLISYAMAALGDGLVGVPWADLTGSSLDDKWRARLYGLMTAIGGLIMLAVTPIIALILGSENLIFPQNYALIFAISGVLFVISIFPVVFVHEFVEENPAKSVPSINEYLSKLTELIQHDRLYRHIVIAQILTSLYMMAMPFYIGFGTTQLGIPSETAVPLLLAIQTVGNIGGALLYTWLGARNNVLYIRIALIGGAILPFMALIASFVGIIPLYIGFLLSGVATSNLMFGYQNWIITHAPSDERPIYIGLSNTIIAIVSLIAPIIGGAIVQSGSYTLLFTISLSTILLALFTLPRGSSLLTNHDDTIP